MKLISPLLPIFFIGFSFTAFSMPENDMPIGTADEFVEDDSLQNSHGGHGSGGYGGGRSHGGGGGMSWGGRSVPPTGFSSGPMPMGGSSEDADIDAEQRRREHWNLPSGHWPRRWWNPFTWHRYVWPRDEDRPRQH